jgi:hypothetical protein
MSEIWPLKSSLRFYLLENQVNYYNITQGLLSIFVEKVLDEDQENTQIKRDFSPNSSNYKK